MLYPLFLQCQCGDVWGHQGALSPHLICCVQWMNHGFSGDYNCYEMNTQDIKGTDLKTRAWHTVGVQGREGPSSTSLQASINAAHAFRLLFGDL